MLPNVPAPAKNTVRLYLFLLPDASLLTFGLGTSLQSAIVRVPSDWGLPDLNASLVVSGSEEELSQVISAAREGAAQYKVGVAQGTFDGIVFEAAALRLAPGILTQCRSSENSSLGWNRIAFARLAFPERRSAHAYQRRVAARSEDFVRLALQFARIERLLAVMSRNRERMAFECKQCRPGEILVRVPRAILSSERCHAIAELFEFTVLPNGGGHLHLQCCQLVRTRRFTEFSIAFPSRLATGAWKAALTRLAQRSEQLASRLAFAHREG